MMVTVRLFDIKYISIDCTKMRSNSNESKRAEMR